MSDQNGSKTTPFGTAHTYLAYLRESPFLFLGMLSEAKLNTGNCWQYSVLKPRVDCNRSLIFNTDIQ